MSDDVQLSFDSKVIHAGQSPDPSTGAVSTAGATAPSSICPPRGNSSPVLPNYPILRLKRCDCQES